MNLTAQQTATLKAFILADGTLSVKATAGDYDFVANALDANASPDYWVWRSFVSEGELYDETTVDGTSWDWTQYIAQNQGEQGAWMRMVAARGGLRPSLANVRAGYAKIFSGAGAGPVAQRLHINTSARRKATLAEKVLASGTGSTASPATMGLVSSGVYAEGIIGAGDIGGILA